MRRGATVMVRTPRGAKYKARYLGQVESHSGIWLEVRALDAPKGSLPKLARPAMVKPV